MQLHAKTHLFWIGSVYKVNMKEHKVIENKFTWIPLDKRGSSMPPRKPETRKPVLWLARDGDELYFVNASEEVIESVVVSTGGFQTVDDDMLISESQEYEYNNLRPNAAVKVDEYDGFYDLDYVLQVCLRVKSKNLGCLEILSPAKKGGVGETVLLWDTGESGKNVSIKQV